MFSQILKVKMYECFTSYLLSAWNTNLTYLNYITTIFTFSEITGLQMLRIFIFRMYYFFLHRSKP